MLNFSRCCLNCCLFPTLSFHFLQDRSCRFYIGKTWSRWVQVWSCMAFEREKRNCWLTFLLSLLFWKYFKFLYFGMLISPLYSRLWIYWSGELIHDNESIINCTITADRIKPRIVNGYKIMRLENCLIWKMQPDFRDLNDNLQIRFTFNLKASLFSCLDVDINTRKLHKKCLEYISTILRYIPHISNNSIKYTEINQQSRTTAQLECIFKVSSFQSDFGFKLNNKT